MKAIRTYRISDQGALSGDARPDIYVQLDREVLEIRRPVGSREFDEFRIEVSLEEAYQLSATLLELLPKRPSEAERPSFP
jgi:hypothetical protein